MSLEPAPSPRAPATGLPARLCCTLQHRRPRPAGRLNKLCMGNSMNIENMTVAKRLGLGFGLVLLLLAGITTLGTIRLSGLHEKVLSISEGRVPQLLLANNWTFQLLETARHTRNMLIFDEPAKIAGEVEAVMKNKRQRAEYMKQLQQTTVLPQGKALLQDVIESRALYTPLEDSYLALVQKGDMAGAKTLLLGSMRPAQLDYIAKLQKYVVYQNEGVALVGKEAAEEYASGRNMLVALGVAALLAGVAAAWVITRSLLKQLGGEPADAVEAANRIASGDLSAQRQLHGSDKDSLMCAMDAMRDNLARIVAQVRSGTDTIAGASAEIASGNLDLSSRTEQQAGTLEETASSMEELNSTRRFPPACRPAARCARTGPDCRWRSPRTPRRWCPCRCAPGRRCGPDCRAWRPSHTSGCPCRRCATGPAPTGRRRRCGWRPRRHRPVRRRAA